MSFTSTIQKAEMTLAWAEGNFGVPLDRGRLLGGPIAWDAERSSFRDWEVVTPTQAEIDSLSSEEWTAFQGLNGVAWEESLKALILAWRVKPLNIDLDWWLGNATTAPAYGVRTRLRSLPTDPAGGQWAVIRPAGNPGTTMLHQYNSTPGIFWTLTSDGLMDANPCFTIEMYRDAAGSKELGEAVDTAVALDGFGLPNVFTGFTFGGIWHLRFPKWRQAELYRLTANGGATADWQLVSHHEWEPRELYPDTDGGRELFCTVMCLDGQILIKSTLGEDSWLYGDQYTARGVAAAPLTLAGNAGSAYFGLHDVEFAQGQYNRLALRDVARIRDNARLTTPPALWGLCLGSKPAGTKAEAIILQQRSGEWQETAASAVVADRGATYVRPGVRLESTDGKATPVVKIAGLVVPPATDDAVEGLTWHDISDKLISVRGGWQCDPEERCVTQRYTLKLDNREGTFVGWTQNRLIALCLGRPGSEAAGLGGSWDTANGVPLRKLTCLAGTTDGERSGAAKAIFELTTIDGLQMLKDVKIGWREPLDGLTIAQAIRKVLTWCNWPPSMIGTIFDSRKTLPISGQGWKALGVSSEVTGAAIDTESRAACQLRADLSGWDALRWLVRFDYQTFCLCDEAGLFKYLRIGTTSVRQFSPVYAATAEDEVVRRASSRSRLAEGATSVIVQGTERSTGRPLASRANDYEAWADGTLQRFRGLDAEKIIRDPDLNTQALLNKRCRHEWDWLKMLNNVGSLELRGQRCLPTWAVEVDEMLMYVIAVQDDSEKLTGVWNTTIDVVSGVVV